MKTLARFVVMIGTAALLTACGGGSQPPVAPGATIGNGDSPRQRTFKYTGTEQSFKVPSGVTKITVVARGAAGAAEPNSSRNYSARGGRVYAVIPVRAGEMLYVFVGGEADSQSGGYNGGGDGWIQDSSSFFASYGGGGATDIREGGTRLHDRIIVAGGGGGQGGIPGKTEKYGRGGKGGDKTGGSGSNGLCIGGSNCYLSGGGAGGGSQTGGGAGGSAGGCWATCGVAGSNGSAGKGGAGGESCAYPCYGGGNGGGGGGGYYGGGGGGGGGVGYGSYGGAEPYGGGGGGGGSSHVESTATGVRMWQGWRNATGNGLVVFSW